MSYILDGKAVKYLRLPTVSYSDAPKKIIYAQAGDLNSRYFYVSLYDDRGDIDLSQYDTVTLNATLPDETIEMIDGEINIEKNVAVCKITSGMLEQAGKVSCDITFMGQDNLGADVALTSQEFYLLSEESQTSSGAVKRSEGYRIFEELQKEVLELNEAMTEAENKRVEAEEARETAEKQRASAIVQGTGASTDKVMSQKSVTDGLNKKSNATNLENGSAAGSLQQKSATYAQMINDFEPNMAAYIIAKNGGMVPANLQAYLAALQSSTIATSEAIITILDTRRNDINTVITNFKTLPSPYTDYGIDNLIAGQLANYGITSSSDLSNIVGEAADVSAVFGSMNKVFAPGALAGGVNSEAGDKGYPSETMGAFAYGSNVKVKSKWAMGFGKDLQNLGDYSVMFGKGDPEYKVNKDASAEDQINQRKYLDHLADAGGSVVGTGDNRVGRTGVNNGSGNIIAGGSHYIGDKAINNAVSGNQNILGPYIEDSNNANNTVSGLLNYIKKSINCAVFGQSNEIDSCFNCTVSGQSNEIESCFNSLIAGERLKASRVHRAFITGQYNADKSDRYIIVGNGTSDAVRSNAFEVLKDGRAKVQTAPKDSNDVVRLEDLNAVGGGKLYLHHIFFACKLSDTETVNCYVKLYKSNNDIITIEQFRSTSLGFLPVTIILNSPPKVCVLQISNNLITIYADTTSVIYDDKILEFKDDVTEL